MKKCMYFRRFLHRWRSNRLIKIEVLFSIFFQISNSKPNFLVKIKYLFPFPIFMYYSTRLLTNFFMNIKGYYQSNDVMDICF